MSTSSRLNIPTTIAERIKIGGEQFQHPATWNQYLDLLEKVEYNLEFDQNTITTVSIASDSHEAIVANILVALSIALDEKPEINIRGSNRHIYMKESKSDFAPDAHVVKGQPKMFELGRG